jgi:TrmH family RNA methyltransferase
VLAHEVQNDVLDQISDSGSPQGVLAVAKAHDSGLPSIAKCRRIVVVDSVQDPGNVGAIVRTAVAAGFEAVITSSGTADLLSPRSIRASAGTIFGLQSARNIDLGSALDSLLAEGHFVVATNSQAEQDFRSLEVTDQMTLVLGSEAHGVSDSILERASALVSIPMGLHVESLNVAVAAGLVMYRMQTIENDH